MVPARSLLRRHYDNYAGDPGTCTTYGHRRQLPQLHSFPEKRVVAPGLMADQQDASVRTGARGGGGGGGGGGGDAAGERGAGGGNEEEGEEEGEDQAEVVVAGTSGSTRRGGRGAIFATGDAGGISGGGCRGDGDDHDGWLRLGIGDGSTVAAMNVDAAAPVVDPSGPRGRKGGSDCGTGLLDLHLFSDRAPPLQMPPVIFQTAAAPYAAGTSSGAHGYRRYQQGVGWGMWNPGPSTSSVVLRLPVPPQPYGMWKDSPQFMYMPGTSSSVAGMAKVVIPPPRPQTGLWFMLLAAQQQAKEPFLPQIPKSYLRTKDGRVIIRLLMKYLVRKLSLESESEVEITCRGQQLHPLLTLQHVRDTIWCSRDVAMSLLDSPSSHVMTLLYGRSSGIQPSLYKTPQNFPS